MTDIKENLKKVKDQISDAEKQAGRTEASVKLLAVSKFHPVEEIVEAIKAGQTAFGENRVQEACLKFTEIYKAYPNVELHIIGQLQTNKVKKAVEIASMIESVDRIDLLKEIEKQAAKINKNISVLFEYHTAEDSKSGFATFEELEAAVAFCAQGNAPHIVPKGFMTMAPFTENEELVKKSFVELRTAAEALQKKFPDLSLKELSMGMSGDYKIAIKEGSTQVRVGTAIFGERDYSKAN